VILRLAPQTGTSCLLAGSIVPPWMARFPFYRCLLCLFSATPWHQEAIAYQHGPERIDRGSAAGCLSNFRYRYVVGYVEHLFLWIISFIYGYLSFFLQVKSGGFYMSVLPDTLPDRTDISEIQDVRLAGHLEGVISTIYPRCPAKHPVSGSNVRQAE
jgi:hypothetical protein